MHVTEWKEPALFWNGSANELGRPRLLEIRSDQFVPVFLQAMMGSDPTPFLQQHQIDDVYNPGAPVKLYQPLHGCYYLVTASLVCRQVGLPDKTIARADGESISFVIRRLGAEGEEAWIPKGESGVWQPIGADDRLDLAPNEERIPMHPVTVCSKPASPRSVFTDNIERDLHYGYIPTGNRDKYIETIAELSDGQDDPATFVNDFIKRAETDVNADPGISGYSFRADLYQRRVHMSWSSLIAAQQRPLGFPKGAPTSEQEQKFYLLLELGDFLRNNLPTFWLAVMSNSSASLTPDMETLFLALRNDWTIDRTSGGNISFLQALQELESLFNLVRGQGDKPENNYNIADFLHRNIADNFVPVTQADIDSLRSQAGDAIGEESGDIQLPDGENSELFNLIRHQVRPTPEQDPIYVIRTAYEYDPDCPPVLSALPSQPFELAKFFDPDAPARMVRLEMPSIKPQDLRKYARGVGIQMTPELHKITSCLAGDDADAVVKSAEDCDGGLSFQMVCTFSIQIIFLVAFIVMFIFLIALNFIFWWLPFLRICLPIPKAR